MIIIIFIIIIIIIIIMFHYVLLLCVLSLCIITYYYYIINLMFQFGLVPTINKPTRVTNKAISAIDHIITNSIYNNDFKTGIIKTDISGHFPIIYAFKLRSSMSSENHQKIDICINV